MENIPNQVLTNNLPSPDDGVSLASNLVPHDDGVIIPIKECPPREYFLHQDLNHDAPPQFGVIQASKTNDVPPHFGVTQASTTNKQLSNTGKSIQSSNTSRLYQASSNFINSPYQWNLNPNPCFRQLLCESSSKPTSSTAQSECQLSMPMYKIQYCMYTLEIMTTDPILTQIRNQCLITRECDNTAHALAKTC